MRLFLRVASVQMRCLFSSMSRQDRSCLARVALLLAYLVLGAFVLVYSALLGVGLSLLGAADAVPAMGAVIAAVIGLVFTVFKASSLLFEAHDYGTMMSWPISARAQVAARLAPFIVTNALMCAVVVVPMGVAAMVADGVTVSRVASLVACVALGPLPATGVAVLLSAGITLATARVRHAKAVYTVVMVALVLVALMAYFAVLGTTGTMSGDDADLALLTAAVASGVDSLCAAWPPAAWLREAWLVPGAGLGAVALFCAVCLAVGAAALWVVARIYGPIMGALSTSSGPRRAASAARARTPLRALCRKELAQVFDTTSVVVNDLIGLLLMVVLAGVLAYMGVGGALNAMDVPESLHPQMLPALYAALPWVLAFCAAMAPVPAISVSLEGACSWIMQTVPVPVATLMLSKVLPWLLACLATSALSAVLVSVAGVPWPVALLCVAVPCADFWFTANLGLFLDARSPDFTWTNPAALAKRGVSITVAVLVTMVLGVAVVALLVAGTLVFDWSEAAVLGASLGVAVVLAAAGTLLFRITGRRQVPRQAAES